MQINVAPTVMELILLLSIVKLTYTTRVTAGSITDLIRDIPVTPKYHGSYIEEFLHDIPTPGTGPYVDTSVTVNVTGQVGKTVHLKCRVKNIGNKTVSWIRHRDIHLLTVGRYTYTSDQRFEIIHFPHTEDWTLKLKYAQRKDTGFYECQISTTPPFSYPIYLNIVEPKSEILGGPELFVNNGSTINLTCIVEFTGEVPSTIEWSHNGNPIDFDSPRGGISLITVKGPSTNSRLLIQKATPDDSGEYTCDSFVAKQAIIRVHILNGEHPAAMHHGNTSIRSWSSVLNGLLVLFGAITSKFLL